VPGHRVCVRLLSIGKTATQAKPAPFPGAGFLHLRGSEVMADPTGLAERSVAPSECGHYVVLSAPGVESVRLGPYPNPAIAREKMGAIRALVTAWMNTTDGSEGAARPKGG
jgi:hypothetical protein